MTTTPRGRRPDSHIGAIEKSFEAKGLAATNKKLDPFRNDKSTKEPFYFSGARGFIRIGGNPAGIFQDCRWTITYNATPIYTIDSVHAWDIDIGTLQISATMTQIMDPTKGPEADGLFHTMQAAIHQPQIEIQLIDKKLGTSIFFARGMFTSVTGNVAKGQLGTWSASFVGTAYQHYANQSFKPYDSVAGALSGLTKGLSNLASSFTGGIL